MKNKKCKSRELPFPFSFLIFHSLFFIKTATPSPEPVEWGYPPKFPVIVTFTFSIRASFIDRIVNVKGS